MSKLQLTDEAKMLIHRYLFKRFLAIGTTASIISFLLGFFIKDIAKAEAYNEAYTNASEVIIQITNRATESANKIKDLEGQFNKLTTESEKILIESKNLKAEIQNTLVIQRSNDIITSITNNLSKNSAFQSSVSLNTSSRLNQLEAKTKNISADEYGNTIFKNNVKVEGSVTASSILQ
jgi:hypothetical protein